MLKTILLTGASGVVGQALLAQLNAHSVICLTHRQQITNSGVTSIPCDISLPQLGLTLAQLRNIAERIDCVVHAAAVTDFSESNELINRTNVYGLENMLKLSAIAKVPFYYISTAFAHPQSRTNSPPEHAYTISKRQGEQLVRESGLPNVILRPSIVIGDSKSGLIARFQGIYNIAGSLIREFLPILPLLPEAYVDFVPQDVVAKAIVALIEEDYVEGEYWLTSGTQAIKVQKTLELIVEFAKSRGFAMNSPRLVSTDIVERLIRPAFMSTLPKSINKGFDWFTQVTPYLSSEDPFPTSLPEISAQCGLPPLPNLETAFIHSLEYWAVQTRLCPSARNKTTI
jgi:nucleoside-diphosphate-sugar epimerase